MIKKILKAGTYYIGDPCYIFNETWSQILKETNYLTDLDVKIFEHEYFCSDTEHGDGEYKDQFNYKYLVDAGCIGCIPIELLKIDNKMKDEEIATCAKVMTFEEDFECFEDDGVIHIGHIKIDTNIYDDYEEDEEEEY